MCSGIIMQIKATHLPRYTTALHFIGQGKVRQGKMEILFAMHFLMNALHCNAMQWIEKIKAVIKLVLQATLISGTDKHADLRILKGDKKNDR